MESENNVAAQAGDEPMDYAQQLRAAVETVCEGWTLPPGARKTLEAALWAPQVSPLATADVERDSKRLDHVYFLAMVEPFIAPVATKERWLESVDRSMAERATTKPGA